MSLKFHALSFKNGFPVTSYGTSKAVNLSGHGVSGIYLDFEKPGAMIPADEFCEIVRYFMENTDLVEGDSRVRLLKDLKRATKVKGYNGSRTRRIHVPRS